MFKLIRLVLCLFVFPCFPVFSNEPDEAENFFSDLFCRDFGYTLIGIKPISTDEVHGQYNRKTADAYLSKLMEMFRKSDKFVLKVFYHGETYYSVELINKNSVRRVVQQNPIVRSFVKNLFKSEEDFYSQLEDPKRNVFNVVKFDDRMLGYLFGYGWMNIEYALRTTRVGTYLQKYPFVRFHPLPGGKYSGDGCFDCSSVFTNRRLFYEDLKPSRGFDSLEDEWQWMKRVKWDIEKESCPEPPYFVYLPVYGCRHGDGSEELREKFKKARCQIAELLCNRKPSDVLADFASSQSAEPFAKSSTD